MSKIKGLFRRGKIWWLRYSVDGVQRRESLDTELEQLAAVKAIAILHRAPIEASGEWERELDAYLLDAQARRKLSWRFARPRRYVLMRFAREYNISKVADVSVSVVEKWLRDLGVASPERRAIKPGTIEGYHFHLRAFCTWLVKKNKLRENVAAAYDLGEVERSVRKNFLSKDTVARLIANAPSEEMRFILYCGLHAGMRRLEVVEARPEWFRLGENGRRGCVVIGQTETFSPKDRDERTVPLSAEFEAFLRRYGMPSPFMIRPKKTQGKAIYRYDFRKAWDAYMKDQEVRCTFHDTRRTFVSLKLIEDSSLIFKLAKWTGDDVKVLQTHYAHLLADDEDIEVGL